MVQEIRRESGHLERRQNLQAVILKRYPLEPSEGEGTENSDKIEGEDAELNDPVLLHWRGFLARQQSKHDGDSESLWSQEVVIPDNLPTHLQPFRNQGEYLLVKQTYLFLQQSGFYWGTVSMEQAHHMLRESPPGTFLIRDSCQCNVFFTLSYQGDDEPTSVRLILANHLFSLDGSLKKFESLFALLDYYTTSSSKIAVPYRWPRPESLQQLGRRAVIRAHGAHAIDTLPGLSVQVKDYLHAYPYCV